MSANDAIVWIGREFGRARVILLLANRTTYGFSAAMIVAFRQHKDDNRTAALGPPDTEEMDERMLRNRDMGPACIWPFVWISRKGVCAARTFPASGILIGQCPPEREDAKTGFLPRRGGAPVGFADEPPSPLFGGHLGEGGAFRRPGSLWWGEESLRF